MICLLDSLGFSREWFWDDSGAWKMDRQRVEGQEKHGLCRVSENVRGTEGYACI